MKPLRSFHYNQDGRLPLVKINVGNLTLNLSPVWNAIEIRCKNTSYYHKLLHKLTTLLYFHELANCPYIF